MQPLSRPLVCRPVLTDYPTSVWGRSWGVGQHVPGLGRRAPWRTPCGTARPDPGKREEEDRQVGEGGWRTSGSSPSQGPSSTAWKC